MKRERKFCTCGTSRPRHKYLIRQILRVKLFSDAGDSQVRNPSAVLAVGSGHWQRAYKRDGDLCSSNLCSGLVLPDQRFTTKCVKAELFYSNSQAKPPFMVLFRYKLGVVSLIPYYL